MARNNYFNRGDEYSEWHRSIEDSSLGYIDLDCVEFHKSCGCVLFVAETCRWTGKNYKNTTLTRKIARKLEVPAYLIFYIPHNRAETPNFLRLENGCYYDPTMRFKIARIENFNYNSNYPLQDYSAKEWVQHLQEARVLHKCNSSNSNNI